MRARISLEALGQALFPSSPSTSTPINYRRIGALSLLILGILIPALAFSVFGIVSAYSGDTPQEFTQIVGGSMFIIASYFFPRLAFRSSVTPTAKVLFATPKSETFSIAGSSVIFRPILVAMMLAAIYVPTMASAVGLFIMASFLQALAIYYVRSRRGDRTSVYEMLVHIALTTLSAFVVYLAVNWYGHDWATNAYWVRLPLTDPDMMNHTILLGLLLLAAGVLAKAVRSAAKWVLMNPTGALGIGVWAYTFDMRRLLVSGLIGVGAWTAAWVSEYAVGESDAVLGLVLAMATWLGIWTVLWFVSAILWRNSSDALMQAWEKDSWVQRVKIDTGQITFVQQQQIALQHAARALIMIFGAERVDGIIFPAGSLTGKSENVSLARHGQMLVTETSHVGTLPATLRPQHTFKFLSTDGSPLGEIAVARPRLAVMRFAAWMTRELFAGIPYRLSNTMSVLSSTAVEQGATTQIETLYSLDLGTPNMTAFTEAVNALSLKTAQRGEMWQVFVAVIRADTNDRVSALDPTGLTAQIARSLQASSQFSKMNTFAAYDPDAFPNCVWVTGRCPTVQIGREQIADALIVLENTEINIAGESVTPVFSHAVSFYRQDGLTADDLIAKTVANLDEQSLELSTWEGATTEFNMAHLMGTYPTHDFDSAVKAGDVQLDFIAVESMMDSTMAVALAGYFTWTNFPYGNHLRLGNTDFLEYVWQEGSLRDTALPYMVNTFVEAVETMEAEGVALPMRLHISLPTSLLYLPSEQIIALLTPLTRIQRSQGRQVNIGLVGPMQQWEPVEGFAALKSLGLGVASSLDNFVGSIREHKDCIDVIALSPDYVAQVAEGDLTALEVAALYGHDGTLLVGVAPLSLEQRSRLQRLGLSGIVDGEQWRRTADSVLRPALVPSR